MITYITQTMTAWSSDAGSRSTWSVRILFLRGSKLSLECLVARVSFLNIASLNPTRLLLTYLPGTVTRVRRQRLANVLPV
jgi:hypothetical protein